MSNQTVLNEIHREAGGKMVDFGGWDMPLHYGSQLKEHLQVRQSAGMFDVSHMTVVDVFGDDATNFLRKLLANDVAKLRPGQAQYTLMLNEAGGVVDDLIVYFLAAESYRLVVNCATREKDLAWLQELSLSFTLSIQERPDLAIVAVQGPQAQSIFASTFSDRISQPIDSFHHIEANGWTIAATGYTGEQGFEIILPNEDVSELWSKLQNSGVTPVGLGARDTLRLEAGYCLYGNEMDEQTDPLSANLGWTLNFDDDQRDFVGRQAVEAIKRSEQETKLVGLVLEDRGILRAEQKVVDASGEVGAITSGSYSPTLEKSIALAQVPMSVSDHCLVLVRDRKLRAKIVKPAFVREGKILV